MNYKTLNGSNLAYIGDAYYELEIRKYLLSKNITRTKELRSESIKYVSASAHALICNLIFDMFTEEEKQIFLRGRNGAPSSHRKNVNPKDYGISSGFEAIIGYNYLSNNVSRCDEIIALAIKAVEESK